MRAVALAVLAAAFALPSAAEAATVTVSAPAGASNRTLTVTVSGATRVTVSRSDANLYVAARTTDTLNQSGTGCTSLDGGFVCGAESQFGRIVVNGSSGNDEIAISPSVTRASTLDGNGGNDEIAGGAGPDTIDGDTGNDIISGGDGNDDLNGSAGDDVLVGDLGNDVIDGGTGNDVMSGGGQAGDALDYANRTVPVTVDLNRQAPQGVLNENDTADGFAVVLGGSGADTLSGTDAPERLEGNGGADILNAGGGNDTLNGGSGNDALTGGAGADTFNGGDGEDALNARDGAVDTAIACGAARDRLATDTGDPTPADCEVVAPIVLGAIAVGGDGALGTTLNAAFSGSVAGSASTLAWRWDRCTAAGCAAVAEGPAYAVTEADIGAQLRAVLRADNEAGTGELASAPVGPIAPPAPAPAPAPAATPAPTAAPPKASVRSVRCSGRRCRVALTVTGTPASLKVVLSRGGRRLASTTRKTPQGRFTLTVTAKRKLKRGSYRVRITAPGVKAVTRTVRVKR